MIIDQPAQLAARGHRDAEGGYVLQLVGEVDLSSLPVLAAQIAQMLATTPTRVRVDLSGVTFIDSSGIGALIGVAHAVPDIALVNPSPTVARLVQLCGLAPILPTLSMTS